MSISFNCGVFRALFVCVVCAGMPLSLTAQLPDSEPEVLSIQNVPAEISELIEQLASPEFTTREAATAKLMQIGYPALAELRSIVSLDNELLIRAQMIAKRIEDDRFETLSSSFLLDGDPSHSYGLPAWSVFSEMVGSSRTSKLLFLDMLRRQPELTGLIDRASSHPKISQDLLRNAATREAVGLAERRMRLAPPEIGDLVAILVATSLFDGQAPIEINDLLESSAQVLPVSTYMRKRGYGTALRRLYDLWIPKTHDAMGFRAIYISLQYGLQSGAEVARKHLTGNFDVPTRELAILCLTQFGNKSDIPLLTALINDNTLCDRFSKREYRLFLPRGISETDEPPPGAPRGNATGNDEDGEAQWVVRINDLAFAAAISLSGDNPEELFTGFMRHEQFGFESRSVAILADPDIMEQRDQLFRQWKSDYETRIAGS